MAPTANWCPAIALSIPIFTFLALITYLGSIVAPKHVTIKYNLYHDGYGFGVKLNDKIYGRDNERKT
jgi:hypothetical protein